MTVCGYIVLVCSQSLRPTQPPALSGWEISTGEGMGQWQCCSAGKVTVGLALHRHRDTDSMIGRARYTSFSDRSFSVAGPRAWNALPPSLRQDISCGQFKRLKTFLFRSWIATAYSHCRFLRRRNSLTYLLTYLLSCLQCFDTVDWASGRASGL